MSRPSLFAFGDVLFGDLRTLLKDVIPNVRASSVVPTNIRSQVLNIQNRYSGLIEDMSRVDIAADSRGFLQTVQMMVDILHTYCNEVYSKYILMATRLGSDNDLDDEIANAINALDGEVVTSARSLNDYLSELKMHFPNLEQKADYSNSVMLQNEDDRYNAKRNILGKWASKSTSVMSDMATFLSKTDIVSAGWGNAPNWTVDGVIYGNGQFDFRNRTANTYMLPAATMANASAVLTSPLGYGGTNTVSDLRGFPVPASTILGVATAPTAVVDGIHQTPHKFLLSFTTPCRVSLPITAVKLDAGGPNRLVPDSTTQDFRIVFFVRTNALVNNAQILVNKVVGIIKSNVNTKSMVLNFEITQAMIDADMGQLRCVMVPTVSAANTLSMMWMGDMNQVIVERDLPSITLRELFMSTVGSSTDDVHADAVTSIMKSWSDDFRFIQDYTRYVLTTTGYHPYEAIRDKVERIIPFMYPTGDDMLSLGWWWSALTYAKDQFGAARFSSLLALYDITVKYSHSYLNYAITDCKYWDSVPV